jgi:acyl-CoA thioesterase FadM
VREPFVHRRKISWSDTDSAQIVYTVRVLEFAMEAIEAWWQSTLGVSWYEMVVDRGTGGPWVHFDADIVAPLTPKFQIESRVFVERVGRTSLSFRVEGTRSDGVESFRAHLTTVFVEHTTNKPVRIPEDLRGPIEAYVRETGS